MNKFKKFQVAFATMAIMLAGTMSVSAASRYNEDQPLKSVKTTYVTTTAGGTTHQHKKITAGNGVSYFLYDSKCMSGMVGTVPTNHSSTVTIDGVVYSLRNYAPSGKSVQFSNVIKQIGTASGSTTVTTPTKPTTVAATSIRLSRTTASVQAGSAFTLTGTVAPSNTTNKTITWSSSNTSVATVKSNGVVTGVKAGKATITAKCGNVVARCTVTVTAKPTTVAATSIRLARTSATIQAGLVTAMSGTVYPSNATNKTITWYSSNTGVATVKSNGIVTGIKAGKATIYAKCGNAVATCIVTVTAKPSTTGTYLNVSSTYTALNSWRMNSANWWYWNSSNTAKVRVTGLKALQRDTTLENVAKIRAKEAWTMAYERGGLTHTRPNGSAWYTAYPSLYTRGENLAGNCSISSIITVWAEANEKAPNQGHRINMLNKGFTKVGIACYEKDNKKAWAMCFGG